MGTTRPRAGARCSARSTAKIAGIGFLCHPDNFRAPQNMRIHPSEPFFNFAPCQTGDFDIAPGKPYVEPLPSRPLRWQARRRGAEPPVGGLRGAARG